MTSSFKKQTLPSLKNIKKKRFTSLCIFHQF